MNEQDSKICFVMMPIKSADEEVYWRGILENIIRPAIKEANQELEVIRVDELPGSGSWLKDIINNTYNSEIVIADITGLNPNVMWELGMRHVCEKTGTIMITQNLKEVPADLLHYKVIPYKDDRSDYLVFKQKIKEMIDVIYSKNPKIDSPFHDFMKKSFVRNREIEFGFFVDDSQSHVQQIILPKIPNSSKEPATDLDHFLARNLIPEGSNDYDEGEIKNYNKRVKKISEDYIKHYNHNIEARYANDWATKLLPICVNRSNNQITDIRVDLTFSCDFTLLEKIPKEKELPQLPNKPPRKGSYKDPWDYLVDMRIFTSTPAMDIQSFLNQGFTGCSVHSGNSVSCHTDKIRQKSAEYRWNPFYLIPHKGFKEAYVDIDVRCPEINGVAENRIQICVE